MSFKPSEHQVAGHGGGLVAKGLFAKLSTDQESAFYTELNAVDSTRSHTYLGELLTHWTPLFYGNLSQNQLTLPLDQITQLDQIQFVNDNHKISGVVPTDKKYILMNNLYEDYINPSILDIKLGKILTDESASPEKVERLRKVSESTTSSSLHYRMCGMKLYHKDSNLPNLSQFDGVDGNIELMEDNGVKYLQFNKYFGRALTKSNMKLALKLYIENSITDKQIRQHYADQFLKRLQLIYNCLLDYEIRIISGSLLFLIENNPIILNSAKDHLDELDPLILEVGVDDDDDDEEENDDSEEHETEILIKKLSSLHLIDFAHAKFVPGKGPDDNILEGIENLINVFQSISQDYHV